MGYDLHITRKTNWFEKEEPAHITQEEWLNYKNSDPELSTSTDSHAGEDYSEWNVFPPESRPYFHYSRGTISVKNPTEEVIAKMLDMARALQAKVQGDEGEIYDITDDERIYCMHEGEDSPRYLGRATNWAQTEAATPAVKKPWWKFW